MKKKPLLIIMLLIVAVLSSFLVSGCGASNSSQSSSQDNSLKRVKQAGKMVIGVDDTYPPMEFRDDKNNLVGFDVDLANAVAKKIGVKVEWVPTAWDGIFLALQAKKFDLIHSSVSITADREKTYIFTKPYIYGGNTIFLKKDNTTIKSADDLKGKVVGCQVGTTAQDVLAKITGIKEVKKYNGMTEAFMELQNGRVEAVVSDPQVGGYYMQKDPGKYKKIENMLNKEPLGIIFRKNDKALRDAYQKALDELKADGTMSKLSLKWFGYDAYK